MASVFDVAKYILTKQGKMSTWKLQKLCYYSQAWSIAWTEKPIFPENFEAWTNGPVCPELFHAHQGLFVCDASSLLRGNPENLPDDQRETIDVVLTAYGSMDPYELRELTHSEGPWKNARGNLPDGSASNAVITNESLGAY